jgi:hypothetical protein
MKVQICKTIDIPAIRNERGRLRNARAPSIYGRVGSGRKGRGMNETARCECGGRLSLALIQIVTGGPRYPLRDRDTGKPLRVCDECKMLHAAQAAERSEG